MSRPSAPGPDVDEVAAGLVAWLPALHRALDRRVGRDCPAAKLPEAQLALLRHVEAQAGVTVRQAADALLMKPNNVSALVTQLTGQGLLERRGDPADKRIAHLHLTSAARRRLDEAGQLAGTHLGHVLRALPDRELDALGAALGALRTLTEQLRLDAP
ncbi:MULTISPECIES: MarR family winged helix-turn-helix transcriptional regulator [unclassified Streptomyces]|uniref:MarR family winged helix-turn-helix transcriptional regulator n=1 Tax=unclassified Streptomyces TaxID=2593676 RepID=UPI003D76630B